MKVLHINAGAETGGGKVHVLSLFSKLNKEQTDLLVFEEGLIAREARKLGVSVTVLNQTSRFDISVTKSIKSMIKQGRYDVVHTHGARANLYMSFINRSAFKWVITVHSDPILDFMGRGLAGSIYTRLNRSALKKADHLITVSSRIRNALVKEGIRADKITTINNGIEFDVNTHNERHKNEQFTLTYIARLHPIKRHAYLLEALRKSEISDYILNLVGDGDETNRINALIKQNKLENNVIMHGFLTKEEINELLSKTDISILTSQSETFPLVLLESANQKVPFITTNVGDVEVIDPNREYSWIVDIDNEKDLVEAIKAAYKEWQNNTLPEKGRKLYEFAIEEFTLDKMVKSTEKVYKTICN